MMTDSRVLLIVVGEAHLFGEVPLYEYVVRRLRQLGLAGATAIRAELGFGHRETAHPSEPLEFPTDRPVVVFAVDRAEKIERVVPEIRQAVGEGVVVVFDARQVELPGAIG